MKAKLITYSRLVGKGNFENAKIEIQLEVEEGEKAADVFAAAKKFVDNRCDVETLSQHTFDRAQKVLDDKRNHTLAQIEDAEYIMSKQVVVDDLPF